MELWASRNRKGQPRYRIKTVTLCVRGRLRQTEQGRYVTTTYLQTGRG